jgi:predicted RNA-binding protein
MFIKTPQKSLKTHRVKNEVFPLRIKLKPIKIFDKPVDFKSLIPKLKFIKNKQKWTGHIQGKAMREIPEEDYNLILEKA